MEIGAEAEVRCGAAIQDRRLARTFVAVVGSLSNVHNAFVFGANFSCGRGNGFSINSADNAISGADFKDKTGKIIERKRAAIVDRRCYRTVHRAAEKSARLLLGQKACAHDKNRDYN